MEWTPYKWRGLMSGIVQEGFSFGAALAAAVEGLFISIYGVKNVELYAWRYIFLTALIPAFVALAIRLAMKETPVFEDIKNRNLIRKTSFFDLFKNHMCMISYR